MAISFGIDIVGIIQWPHLDLGNMGVEKQLEAIDVVCDAPEGVAASVGYDQRNLASRTADHDIAADTLPGTPIPIPVSAPSFDLRLTFAPGQAWTWYAANMYVEDTK